jgi:hypothetical protein
MSRLRRRDTSKSTCNVTYVSPPLCAPILQLACSRQRACATQKIGDLNGYVDAPSLPTPPDISTDHKTTAIDTLQLSSIPCSSASPHFYGVASWSLLVLPGPNHDNYADSLRSFSSHTHFMTLFSIFPLAVSICVAIFPLNFKF